MQIKSSKLQVSETLLTQMPCCRAIYLFAGLLLSLEAGFVENKSHWRLLGCKVSSRSLTLAFMTETLIR